MKNSIKSKLLNIILRSFMTGIAIGIGATAFLSCESKIAGAFLFGTGLFIILNFGFYLYTGKVGYIVEKKPSYIAEVALIWLGNFAGTFVFASPHSLHKSKLNSTKGSRNVRGKISRHASKPSCSVIFLRNSHVHCRGRIQDN